jgi:hypothetical protein
MGKMAAAEVIKQDGSTFPFLPEDAIKYKLN